MREEMAIYTFCKEEVIQTYVEVDATSPAHARKLYDQGVGWIVRRDVVRQESKLISDALYKHREIQAGGGD